MGDSERDKPAAPGEGEVQALAKAEAMLESRDDEEIAHSAGGEESGAP